MACRTSHPLLAHAVISVIFVAALTAAAQHPGGGSSPAGPALATGNTFSLQILVRNRGGSLVDMAIVTLTTYTGQLVGQATTRAGQAEFNGLQPGDYFVRVSAAGYQAYSREYSAIGPGGILYVDLERKDPDSSDASGPAMPVLAPKAQKLAAKAAEALQARKPADALPSLEAAYRLAPGHPYVNFLYGVYYSEINDRATAESYWMKALQLFPQHMNSLLYLSDALLRDNHAADAVPYLTRALELQPAAWRPHAMMAEARLSQKDYDQALKEADRALELGHAQAVGVPLLKANALVGQGNKDQAIAVLQEYLREKPDDPAARKLLESLRVTPAPPSPHDPAPVPPPGSKP